MVTHQTSDEGVWDFHIFTLSVLRPIHDSVSVLFIVRDSATQYFTRRCDYFKLSSDINPRIQSFMLTHSVRLIYISSRPLSRFGGLLFNIWTSFYSWGTIITGSTIRVYNPTMILHNKIKTTFEVKLKLGSQLSVIWLIPAISHRLTSRPSQIGPSSTDRCPTTLPFGGAHSSP
jgi:hypothetical protein